METFVNDTVKITIDTDLDISGYATKQIRYKRPDGTVGRWTASACPADVNCMTYTCVDGDLYIAGEWLIQAIVLDAGVQLTGRWGSFLVHNPLDANDTTAPPTTVAPTTLAPTT